MFYERPYGSRSNFATLVHAELGVQDISGNYERFFRQSELRDFLDSLTFAYWALEGYGATLRNQWLQFVQRVLDEESLPYRIDEEGGIHPVVDEEFDRARQATIRGLDAAGLKAARASFEAAFDAMGVEQSDTLAMVRHAFDALENHMKAKLSVSRLGSKEIEKHLRPLIAKRYEGVCLAAESPMVAQPSHLNPGFKVVSRTSCMAEDVFFPRQRHQPRPGRSCCTRP